MSILKILLCTLFLVVIVAPVANADPTVFITITNNTTITANNTPVLTFYVTDNDSGTITTTLYFNETVLVSLPISNNTNTTVVDPQVDGIWWFWISATNDVTSITNVSLNYSITINPQCLNPQTYRNGNFLINSSGTFCRGAYNTTDSANDGFLIVNANNLVLTGNNTTITRSGAVSSTILMNITGRSNITVRNLNFSTFNHGLRTLRASQINITNSTFSENSFGMRFVDSTNVGIIFNNTGYVNSNYVYVVNTTNITFLNENIYNNTGAGVYIISGSNNVTVADSYFAGWGSQDVSVEMDTASNITIKNNTIKDMVTIAGIRLDQTVTNAVVVNNTIYNCTIGIDHQSSNNTVIENNSIFNNTNRGINIVTSTSQVNINITIKGNRIYNNTQQGIYVSFAANNTIQNNSIYNNSEGIVFSDGNNTSVISNEIYNNTNSILNSSTSFSNVISNSSFFNGSVYLSGSGNLTLLNASRTNPTNNTFASGATASLVTQWYAQGYATTGGVSLSGVVVTFTDVNNTSSANLTTGSDGYTAFITANASMRNSTNLVEYNSYNVSASKSGYVDQWKFHNLSGNDEANRTVSFVLVSILQLGEGPKTAGGSFSSGYIGNLSSKSVLLRNNTTTGAYYKIYLPAFNSNGSLVTEFYNASIASVSGTMVIIVFSNGRVIAMSSGEIKHLDLNSDGINDIKITVHLLSNQIADLTIELLPTKALAAAQAGVAVAEQNVPAERGPQKQGNIIIWLINHPVLAISIFLGVLLLIAIMFRKRVFFGKTEQATEQKV